jgi:hypothetical protein
MIWHAELAADFDQLTARYEHLLTLRQRVQQQKDGGGIIVHDRRFLCAGDLHEEGFQVPVPISAPALGEVELQIHRTAGRVRDRFDRLLRQQRAAEIGMQDRARKVEHGLQRSGRGSPQAGAHPFRDALRRPWQA